MEKISYISEKKMLKKYKQVLGFLNSLKQQEGWYFSIELSKMEIGYQFEIDIRCLFSDDKTFFETYFTHDYRSKRELSKACKRHYLRKGNYDQKYPYMIHTQECYTAIYNCLCSIKETLSRFKKTRIINIGQFEQEDVVITRPCIRF